MSEVICQTTHLYKQNQKKFRLQDINLTVHRGEIFGLIGENGAGKTTLIKILTGLVQQSDGQVSLFGESDKKGLAKSRSKIGCIVEAPALHEEMTAYQNLNVHRIKKGIPGKECIAEVLELVNLSQVEEKKVKHFSLGMKQRLGLAVALLGEPELLILDEPINGLDPTGIVEFRDILIRLNKEHGTTIIISSHILSELHKLASSFGILHKGELLQQITAQTLDEKCKKHVHLKVDHPQVAISFLETYLGIKNYEVLPNQTIKIYEALDQTSQMNKILAQHSLYAHEITVKGDSLESYFTRVIGGAEHV